MNTTFDANYDHSSAQGQADNNSASPRKRGRAPEQDLDPKVAAKRAKAAERQRRKRERDRRNTNAMHSNAQAAGPSTPAHQPPPPPVVEPPPLTREEEQRREKVRAAARERQRKHRALVKQKKMAELGLSMGENGMLPEEVHYALQPDGHYQPVIPQNTQPPEMANADHPYQPGTNQTGGQTFASTLLLSLSCSPLLKTHLLRSLAMTNEELCSIEPILCAAWDQWDHARRLHYAEQAAKANAEHQQNGEHDEQKHQVEQNSAGPSNASAPPHSNSFNDFRTRFHRPLTAPSPFGIITTDINGTQGTIDPNLNGGSHSTSFAEAVAKVAMAANGGNVHANGIMEEEEAEGGSGSEDADADSSNGKDEQEVHAVLADKPNS